MYFRFRWVDCQLGYLRNCLPGRILRALEELPETLDGTYERALKDLDKSNWEFAHRLLQFVAVASRPLRVEELAQFLGFDFTIGPVPKFQQDWLLEDPADAVLSTTSSLLATVDLDGSQVIQFSHFSVKEFLTSSRLAEANDIFVQRYHISMTGAHTLVAQACLGMLLHLDKNITRGGLDKFPLAEYAAEHWIDHARFEDVSLKAEVGMKRLFDPNGFHFAVWVWIHDLEDRYWRREKRGGRPSAPRGTPLHYASLCGLDAIVKFLVLDHSQHVDSRGFDVGSTALHLASGKGHVEVTRFLLDHGADGNARNMRKSTPLHEASIGRHAEVVRVLMERGVDVTAEDDDGIDPVVLAFALGCAEVKRVFLEFGANVTGYDINRWPPLHRALFEGRTEIARDLLERGADITYDFEDSLTPLQAASAGGHAAALRVLLEHGLDVTARADEDVPPLQIACSGGHVEVVHFLLEHGVDVTAHLEDGSTPLHFAVGLGHVELARLLLEHSADMEAQGDNGRTPLHAAVFTGFVETARLLLKRGANVTARDNDGSSPLHIAAARGRVELARLVLECGANVMARDNDEETPLHIATAKGHVELACLLLDFGADTTAQSNNGQTPLHVAEAKGHVELTRLLLERGTPSHVVAAEGNGILALRLPGCQEDEATQADDDSVRTPIQALEADGPMKSLGLPPSPGMDATDQADDGRTPMQATASEGYVEPASLLSEPRAVMTIQAAGSNELNPSNVPATEGDVEYTRSLTQPGLDATTHVDDGQTPLRMAPQREHEDIARALPNHGAEAIVYDDRRWCRCIVQ